MTRPHASARARSPWTLLVLAGALLPAPALAQDAADPPEGFDRPPPPDRSQVPPLRDDADPVGATLIDPADAPRPGLTGGVDWLEQLERTHDEHAERMLFPEESVLTARSGTLRRLDLGPIVFIPDPTASRPADPPMLLLPSAQTDRLRELLPDDDDLPDRPARTPGPVRIALTARATIYHDRNYLLPLAFRQTTEPAPEPAPTAPADTSATTPPEPDPTAPSPLEQDDPDVQDLIRDLRDRPSTVRILEPTAPTLPAPPGAPPGAHDTPTDDPTGRASSAHVPMDGTPIIRRRARVLRDDLGRWTVAFDNGIGNGPSLGPLVILPCTLLMQLERRVEQGSLPSGSLSSEDAEILISGRVYHELGSGYLLPTLYQILPRDGIDPMQ